MNRIFKAGKIHYKKLVEFLSINVSRTLPMLQGIDFPGETVNDGYSFYIYGKEINSGITVEGAICISPSNYMYIYVEDKSIFEKLDFFKLIKDKMPQIIKAEETTAKRLMKLLGTMKTTFDYNGIELMKYNSPKVTDLEGEEAEVQLEVNNDDEAKPRFGIFTESDNENIDEILPIVNKAQRFFGKNIYSKSDLYSIVAPRLRVGDFVVCKRVEDGEIVAQGSIEFEKCGISMLGNIYTVETARGQGAGSFIVDSLIKRAEKNFTVPFLFVESKNSGAARVYESLGMWTVSSWFEIKIDRGLNLYREEKREA